MLTVITDISIAICSQMTASGRLVRTREVGWRGCGHLLSESVGFAARNPYPFPDTTETPF